MTELAACHKETPRGLWKLKVMLDTMVTAKTGGSKEDFGAVDIFMSKTYYETGIMKAGRTHMCDMYQMTQFVSPSPFSFFEESMKVVFKHLTQLGASKCNMISCLSCLSGSADLQLSTETLPESLHIWFPLRCFCFFFFFFTNADERKSNVQSQNKVAHWGINLTELSWV